MARLFAVTPDASEATKGKVELATTAEAKAGTDTSRAMTPAAAKASSGMFLVGTVTASGAATMDFTSLMAGDYSTYVLDLESIRVSTDDTSLALLASTDNGSSWLAGTTYQYVVMRAPTAGGFGNLASSGAANIQLMGNGGGAGIGNAAGEAYSGSLRLLNVASASLAKQVLGQGWHQQPDGTNAQMTILAGRINTTSAINALRIQPASGTLTGTGRLYGVRTN